MSLTTFGHDENDVLLGSRKPRLRRVPDYASTTGPEVVDLCQLVRLFLLEWQQDVLADILGERADGMWATRTPTFIVGRQNGKTEIVVARIIGGLFLLGEEEIIYSAHRGDTSAGIFRRLVKYLERSKALKSEVKSIRSSNGSEEVLLKSGQHVGFRTRAQEGGRGLSADCIIFDEAFNLDEGSLAALGPTLIAKPNAQVIYTGTPVDQQKHRDGVAFARARESALAGAPGTSIHEWSVDADPNNLDRSLFTDPHALAAANPSLGYHASLEMIGILRDTILSPRDFATECLCIGDWPDTDPGASRAVDMTKWAACTDPGSKRDGPVCFAFDLTPNRQRASIGVAGLRSDGLPHIEVVDAKRGVGWVAERLQELQVTKKPHLIICDPTGPAGSLVSDVEQATGVEVYKVTANEHAQAFGMFFDGVQDESLRHIGQEELKSALDGATTRPLGDGGLAWSRKNSETDISPLVAVTLALWGAKQHRPAPKATYY